MKISSGFWVLGVAVLATGCASVTATGRNASGYPIPYAGTRLNLTAIRGDEVRLAMYCDNGIEAPAHPGWDLPLSLVADTVMLPVDALYPATTWSSRDQPRGEIWSEVLADQLRLMATVTPGP